jgi:DNA-binding beta-propeller fold protein YncE
MRTYRFRRSLICVIGAVLGSGLSGCGSSSSGVALAESCAVTPLPLQNARAFALGETFYLPRLSGAGCASAPPWELTSAPPESTNRVYVEGAPEPRFTPDRAGTYLFRAPSVKGAEFELNVVAESARERFRNHYLPALYGAARVGDEIWTANGATYSVTRVRRTVAGAWEPAQEIPVASWPGAIAWKSPLPFALVAQRGSDTIGFVNRDRGVLEDALWVGDEPTGLALSPDATRLYVSLPTMRQVAVVDMMARTVVARVEVGADPRALALSADGARLFVASYRAGNREKDLKGSYGPGDGEALWVIDTGTLTVVDNVPGLAAVHRGIALSEENKELYVAASDGDPIPSQSDASAKPFVHEAIVLGVDAGRLDRSGPLRRADLTRQSGSGGPAVSPASILPVGDTLWVSAESSGLVVALDRQTLAEKARVSVGAGARQLLALDDGSIAVHCTQSNELWFLGADARPLGSVPLVVEDGRPPAVALGEHVFTRPGGNFGVNHGCASCHTEAENDGMVWRFGSGLWDNVRPLQLLSATTPVGWAAYVSNTQVFGYTGPSSIVSRPASPEEAEGLDTFLASLIGAPRATGRTRLDGSYTEAAQRGKLLFEGKALCATCHAPPLYTNREVAPLGKSGEPADVPTLLGVYRHAAFFVKAGARRLENAVDIAADFVGVALSASEKADLVDFLYQLTPKGGAPLGIWPDIDSAEGVEAAVRPWVEFADRVDGTRPGTSAAAVAAAFVKLEKADGGDVPGRVEVDGWRVRFVPDAPLAPNGSYVFRVLPGLPFQSGGELDAERRSRFRVAADPAATWPPTAQMAVELAFPPGSPPTPMPLLLRTTPAKPAEPITVVIAPIALGTQQRQPAWVRLDGDRVLMAPFALPVTPTAVANVSNVVGRITSAENGAIRRVEGTLRLSGPSIDLPGIPFVIDAMP